MKIALISGIDAEYMEDFIQAVKHKIAQGQAFYALTSVDPITIHMYDMETHEQWEGAEALALMVKLKVEAENPKVNDV